tara:strand:- start:1058 stop:1456 length:399 start_codon:yes stop_codon:yes gene_type:complete
MLRRECAPLLDLWPRHPATSGVREVRNAAQASTLTPLQSGVATFTGAILGMFVVALLDASLIHLAITRHLAHYFPALHSCPGVISLTPVALALRGLAAQAESSGSRSGLNMVAGKSVILAVVYLLGAEVIEG